MAEAHVICAVEDVPESGLLPFEVDGASYLLVRDADGHFSVFENVCSHQELALDRGRVEGCRLICPWHGASFSTKDGRALSMPAVAPIEGFETRVEAGRIVCVLED